jgi:hypothetical protein
MNTPLFPIQIKSIYKNGDQNIMLPSRLAKCTPDAYSAIMSIKDELQKVGGELILSDLFRSYDMQYQAHLDYETGKKKAYSPPPGGSLHESGRSMDIDLSKIKISLKDFWAIAEKYGFYPIIKTPSTKLSEAWHFDCRGSHGFVYDYYKKGKGSNMPAYTAMAASAIMAIGVQVDKFAGRNDEAFIQSGLIRLGFDIGNIDGYIGTKTKEALSKLGIAISSVEVTKGLIEEKLHSEFPHEYGLVTG